MGNGSVGEFEASSECGTEDIETEGRGVVGWRRFCEGTSFRVL